MSNDYYTKFKDAFIKDKKFIKSWLVEWDYQKKRSSRSVTYETDKISDFFTYKGKEDLLKWMNWFLPEYPNYISSELTQPLIEHSRANDLAILKKLDLHFEIANYDNRIGINNAHDFIFPQLYPAPERNAIKTVLDFGAGYGRQANLWITRNKNVSYIGMDAIPVSYTLQNLYYHALSENVNDYIDNPDNFKINFNPNTINHIPTWRSDLIPNNSVDLVLCVQVLPELNSKLVSHMMNEFERILKPGGMLYIRDHAYIWKPAGKLNVDSYLNSIGFSLEFKPHLKLDGDLHGIPRIFRKNDPEVIQSQQMSRKAKINLLLNDIDSATGGTLKKIIKTIKK